MSILVVSYNTCDLTLACLRSVYAETTRNRFEIIVVDNASTDGSASAIADQFPDVTLITSTENLGFANANNLAARRARSDWILLLNPDTIVKSNALDTLYEFALARPDGHIFGGRTVFPDGRLDPTSCWGRETLWSSFCRAVGLASLFPKNQIFDSESLGSWKRDSVREVDIITGCLLLIRRRDWVALDGFDAGFFMYGEDADLCLRAENMGMVCLICPDAEIIHYGGASEKIVADKMVRLYRARAGLYQRHWSPAAARIGLVLLDLSAGLRLVFRSIAGRNTKDKTQRLDAARSIWRQRSQWRNVE